MSYPARAEGLVNSTKAQCHRKPKDKVLYFWERWKTLRKLARSSYVSWPRKARYQKLVESTVSNPLERWLGVSLEKICYHLYWVPGTSYFNNSEFSLTWWLDQNALPLSGLVFKAGLADMPDCPRGNRGIEETAELTFCYGERDHPFWEHVGEVTARIDPKQVVLLDVDNVVDNFDPLWQVGNKECFSRSWP